MISRMFDVIVIGAGPAGEVLARRLAGQGHEVAIVESELVGGECSYYACMPSKALLRPAGALAAAVRRDGPDVTVTLSDGRQIRGEEILVAVGRRPRTQDLGLQTVGLWPGQPVRVDDSLAVPGLPWLYAIGDVNGRSLLIHMGKYQAHVLPEILGGHPGAVSGDDATAPRVVFTDPQVAATGLTLQVALDQGVQARAYDVPSSATAGAAFHGTGTPGTARIVVDERRGVIVGATFTGTEVAEWRQAATIAIVSKTPVDLLWQAVPAFPARSEIWLKLLERREAVRRPAISVAVRDQQPAKRSRTTNRPASKQIVTPPARTRPASRVSGAASGPSR